MSCTIDIIEGNIIYKGYKIEEYRYHDYRNYLICGLDYHDELKDCFDLIDYIIETKDMEIDSVKEIKGNKIKCVEDTENEVLYLEETSCKKCYFKNHALYCPIKCQDFERKDGKFVHFEEVE